MKNCSYILFTLLIAFVEIRFITSSDLGKPKVSLTLNSSEPLKENGAAVLICEVEPTAGNAKDLHYKWFLNDKEVTGVNSAILRVPNLNRSVHHESVYKCKVSNDVGEGEDKLTVEIQCKIINLTVSVSS